MDKIVEKLTKEISQYYDLKPTREGLLGYLETSLKRAYIQGQIDLYTRQAEEKKNK